jgi:hypothetical protein
MAMESLRIYNVQPLLIDIHAHCHTDIYIQHTDMTPRLVATGHLINFDLRKIVLLEAEP